MIILPGECFSAHGADMQLDDMSSSSHYYCSPKPDVYRYVRIAIPSTIW